MKSLYLTTESVAHVASRPALAGDVIRGLRQMAARGGSNAATYTAAAERIETQAVGMVACATDAAHVGEAAIEIAKTADDAYGLAKRLMEAAYGFPCPDRVRALASIVREWAWYGRPLGCRTTPCPAEAA